MASRPDPLWSPYPSADDDVARLERLLRVYRHQPSTPPPWTASPVPRSQRRRWRAVAAVGALAATLALATWWPWRLAWTDGAAWPVAGLAHIDALPLGGELATSEGEHARIEVARIGSLAVSPDTRLSLVETRGGHHRIALDHGHVRARIWAPPGHFGVRTGDAEVIDLGCEFDLWATTDGHGRMLVRNGWVMHAAGGRETLVPAGHAIVFDDNHAGIPRRGDIPAALDAAIDRVDRAMSTGARAVDAEQAIAAQATHADAFALLSLLTRYPELADGPLYPRLARLLDVPADDTQHRTAWRAGSIHAIEAWWDRIPRPPKQWWRNWRDALPLFGAVPVDGP